MDRIELFLCHRNVYVGCPNKRSKCVMFKFLSMEVGDERGGGGGEALTNLEYAGSTFLC